MPVIYLKMARNIQVCIAFNVSLVSTSPTKNMIIHFEVCYSHASDVTVDMMDLGGFPFPENMTHLNLDYMFVAPPGSRQ